MKITRSPMARLMVAMATFLLVFPIPANACDLFRRVRSRNCQRVRIVRCQPVRICQPSVVVGAPISSGTVIVDPTTNPAVIVDQNAGSVQIPSVVTPTGQAPAPPQVDNAAPNSGPPAPITGFSLEGVKSSAVETTPPLPINDTAGIQQRIAESIRNSQISPEARRIILNEPLNFQLHTPQSRTFSLVGLNNRGDSVKAAQEDTPDQQPVISLLNLGGNGVKAAQDDATPPPQPQPPQVGDVAAAGAAEPEAPPVAADAFVLANQNAAADDDDDLFPTPLTEIMGADKEYKVGDLIELWVKPLSEDPEDLASVKYTWTVLPLVPIKVWPDASRVLFGTGPSNTTYVVILNASYVFTEEDPGGKTIIHQRTAVAMASVKVGTGTAGPVEPTDPSGPSLTGVSRLAYDWTSQVNRTNTYTEANLKTDAARLATSFRSVAARIQDGTLTDVSSILRATKNSNDTAIEARDQWLPWFTKMSEFLQKSYNDGTIKTTAQFQEAWLAIATGLDAAAK